MNNFFKTLLSFSYKQYILAFVLSALSIITLFPLAIMVLLSTKSYAQMITGFWKIPSFSEIQWDNYVFGLEVTIKYIGNSILVSLFILIFTLILSTLTAYAISCMRFKGHKQFFTLVWSLMLVPGLLTLVPLYLIVRELGLIDTYWAMIIPCVAGSQIGAIFFFKMFFDQIPRDLIEAAYVDGAGELHILRHVIIPLSMPIFSTISIMNILASWNEYIMPLIFFQSESLRTIPLGLAFLDFQHNMGLQQGKLIAAYMIASLPMLIVFFIALKPFMKGMTSGAIKM